MNATQNIDRAQELKKLTEEWAAAELRGDAAFLERTLADDFVGIGPRGFTLSKADWLQRITSGALKYEQLDWNEVSVRLYGDSPAGPDAAIVIGRQSQKAKYQGQPVEGEFRASLVFVKQEERWHLAGLQLSPIAGPPPGIRS